MEFVGYVVVHTQRSVLFHGHHWHAPEWLPRSQADICWSPETGETFVRMSGWIAGKKGLEEMQERCPDG